MPIDRDQLYSEQNIWLPSNNALGESEQRLVNESVIAQIGDDENNYPEVLCKSLRAIGYVNVGKSTSSSGVKKERIGQHEIEYFDGDSSSNSWPDFIDNLPNVCPLFGYDGLSTVAGGAIRVHAAEVFDPNPI